MREIIEKFLGSDDGVAILGYNGGLSLNQIPTFLWGFFYEKRYSKSFIFIFPFLSSSVVFT
ncbi:MAG: hypothetical protein AB7E37_03485 [Candidatus Altimarinota bacterium]